MTESADKRACSGMPGPDGADASSGMGKAATSAAVPEGAPKVSIIVPAYNSERYIGECLDSILGQTLQDIEVLCVNDGSTDGTLAIMNAYADKDDRVHVIDKPNSGYGDSMNRGIDAARGEFMGSVDSDDVVVPECYETLYNRAQRDCLDFIKSDRTWFVGAGEEVKSRRLKIARSDEVYGQIVNPSSNPALCCIKPGQPGLYRMSFLNAHGIRHNDSPGASFQDTGFWAQSIFDSTRAEVISEQLYMVRRDNPNSSELDMKKVFEICNEYKFIREKAGDVPPERREVCIKSCASMMFDSYYWNIKRLVPEQAEAFLKRFHDDFLEKRDAGELDSDYFADKQWEQVQLLIEHPVLFYARYCDKEKQELKAANKKLKADNKQLTKECRKIAQSKSYRIGKAITGPARAVRESLHGARKKQG